MGLQNTIKVNPRQLKMEKVVSSENDNLVAQVQYNVNFSLREDHVKIVFRLSGRF